MKNQCARVCAYFLLLCCTMFTLVNASGCAAYSSIGTTDRYLERILINNPEGLEVSPMNIKNTQKATPKVIPKVTPQTASTPKPKQTSQKTIQVSIIALIANPEKYDGKRVQVIGVGYLEFESNAVYISRDDAEYVNKNGLWVDPSELTIPYEDAQKYNGKYVLIEGTFDKNNLGHLNLWSGAIVNVTRYVLLEK